jgi:hypothetical protein
MEMVEGGLGGGAGKTLGTRAASCSCLRVEGEQGRDGNVASTSPITLRSSGDES